MDNIARMSQEELDQLFEDEFITLMNGDVDLRLYNRPVPIDEDQELYQQGWRSYIYVKREYDVPDSVVKETAEHQYWAEIDKLRDAVEDRRRAVEDVAAGAAALVKVLQERVAKSDSSLQGDYLEEQYSLAQEADAKLKSTVEELELLESDLCDNAEPEFGHYQVGIVSPTFAGVKECEDLIKHISWPGGRPPRNSHEWQMAACQELIFHGTCAPTLDFLAVTGSTFPDRRCLKHVMASTMTGAFLDKQLNAIGATGWDWIKGDVTGTRRLL